MTRAPLLFAAAVGLLAPLAMLAPAHADSSGAYVEGRVVDAAGHPFGGMSVALGVCKPAKHAKAKRFGCTGATSSKQYNDAVAVTDPNGRYTIRPTAGQLHSGAGWRYYVVADDQIIHIVDATNQVPHTIYASTGRIKTPRAGHDVKAATIVVPTPAEHASWTPPATPGWTPAVTGAVTSAAGAPVIGLLVPQSGLGSSTDWNHYAVYRAQNEVPPRTTFPVGLLSDMYQPYQETVAAAPVAPTTHNVTMTAKPVVMGRVKVPHAGRGWRAHVRIRRAADGASVGYATTDAQGHFTVVIGAGIVHRAPGGPYTVQVKAVRLHPRAHLSWTSTAPIAGTPGTTTHLGHLTVHRS